MLRVLTYNIHKAIGNDRKYFLDRIIEILKKSQADIIALQEVDYLVPRSHKENLALRIAQSLGYEYEIGLNVYLKQGAYGNAIFSKYPIIHSENLNLTWAIKKRRGCLMSKILIPNSNSKEKNNSFIEIGVMNFHLGLANFERIWQIHQIINSSFFELLKPNPAICLGDTNDRLEKVDEIFLKVGFYDTYQVYRLHHKYRKSEFNTFPSYTPKPLIRIDKIFVNSHWKVIHHKVIRDSLTSIASDHYPVYVDLELLPFYKDKVL